MVLPIFVYRLGTIWRAWMLDNPLFFAIFNLCMRCAPTSTDNCPTARDGTKQTNEDVRIRMPWSFHLRLLFPGASHHVLRMIFGNSARRSRLRGARSGDSLSREPVLQDSISCPVNERSCERGVGGSPAANAAQNLSELTALEHTAFWIGVKDAAAGQRLLQEASGWRVRLLAAMCRIVAPSTNLSLADPDLEALRLAGLHAGRPISLVPGYPCSRELPGDHQAAVQCFRPANRVGGSSRRSIRVTDPEPPKRPRATLHLRSPRETLPDEGPLADNNTSRNASSTRQRSATPAYRRPPSKPFHG